MNRDTLFADFINAVEQNNLGVRGVSVVVDGGEPLSYHFVPEERICQYSASKSFTSVAVGMGIKEGLLKLTDRTLDHFSEYAPAEIPENLEKQTVRDLLMMSGGHGRANLMMDQRQNLNVDSYVRFSLEQPFPEVPGSRFCYNNADTFLAGAILQKAAGCNLVDYLMPRLFEPLGIDKPYWETSPEGYTFGASTLEINVTELRKFGELLLAHGKKDGKQLIPEEWIAEASSKQIENGSEGYGYQFWRGPYNTYRADGAFGQFCIISEEKQAVIAINSHGDNGKILGCFFETLFPKI